ncbi:hypothetical protein HFP72_24990 [Nocardiopsis sp. ARC36]
MGLLLSAGRGETGLCLGPAVGLLGRLSVAGLSVRGLCLVGLRGVGGLAAGGLSVAGVGLLSVRGLGPRGLPVRGLFARGLSVRGLCLVGLRGVRGQAARRLPVPGLLRSALTPGAVLLLPAVRLPGLPVLVGVLRGRGVRRGLAHALPWLRS